MDDRARELFEAELQRRGLTFSIDEESGRHLLEKDGYKTLVSLENVARELDQGEDEERMARFVDVIMTSVGPRNDHWRVDQLYWMLEPNDYVEKADFREEISDLVDRVLVHYDAEAGRMTWATASMLEALGVSLAEASTAARGNLGVELAAVGIETSDMQGVTLGMVPSYLPFKSSLILAPNLKKVAGEKIGWPLLAVAPVRDFVYLWPAEHLDFAGRVGKVVVREYQNSSYPISTEVFRIDDEGIVAIGAFPVEAPVAE